MNETTQCLLNVENLKAYFFTSGGTIKAVDGVSFKIEEGKTVGLVGESGCGKSTVALAIMRLVPIPGRVVGGRILFKGEDLLTKTERKMREIRGGKIAMSFQDPMTFFNPVMRVGDQIVESITLHQKIDKKTAMEIAVKTLEIVGIPDPPKAAISYPHQLSGGMRQRCMMAMALSCNPELLIADEPTTAIDVIVQAQLLELMKDLKKKLHMSTLVISHDLGVIIELSDDVLVMYAGKIVECADVRTILRSPKHPYTVGLLESIPKVGLKKERLKGIEGTVPDLINLPTGCRFHPRCPYANDFCKTKDPAYRELEKGHFIACHNPMN